MSSGPETQAAFIALSQSTEELHASQSGLFYISQEVSKLTSCAQSCSQVSNPPSMKAHETRQAPFRVKRETGDAGSSPASKCCWRGPLMWPHNQEKDNEVESRSSNGVSLESKPASESHWRALSLINQQCERLLQRGDESHPSSASATKCVCPTAKPSTSAAGNVGDDVITLKHTPEHPQVKCDQPEMPVWVSVMKNTRDEWRWHDSDGSSGGRLHRCVESNEPSSEQPLTDRLECVEENAAADAARDKIKMVELVIIKGLQCEEEEEEEECVRTEQEGLTVPRSENVSPAPVITFGSPDHTMTKTRLVLDLNANLTLMEEPRQPVSPSPSAKEDKTTGTSECRRAAPQLSSGNCKEETPTPALPNPKLCSWRRKTPRKQAHPSRSADVRDPNFQGVTFRMDTELDDSREQCRLLVTCKYSKELHRSVRKRKVRTRASQSSLKISSSDDDVDPAPDTPTEGKVCASCCTRKTPLWRDAEDGTPLCNACGIRYKKYRVRCVNCWHIPRKDGNSKSSCLKCGKFVRPSSAQRKHATSGTSSHSA